MSPNPPRLADLQAPSLDPAPSPVLDAWDREGSLESLIVLLPDELDLLIAPDPAPVPAPAPEPVDPLLALAEDLERELDNELRYGGLAGMFSLPAVYRLIALLVLPLLGLLAYVGRDYYGLPEAQRALHHLHGALRPSGSVGLTLGVLGTVLIGASLVYILRKRFVRRLRFHKLKSWMAFHVFTGLMGPVLVLFHTGFAPKSALGFLGFGALAVVVLSGVLGRYIYVRFPKTLEGRALGLGLIKQRLLVYQRTLARYGIDPASFEAEVARAERPPRVRGFKAVALGLLGSDQAARQALSDLVGAVAERVPDPAQARRVVLLLRRLRREQRWAARFTSLRILMGAWRFVHQWLAIIMVGATFFHVAVAVRFGDLWILRWLGGGR